MNPINKLVLGDNLQVLKQMDDEMVDLIYLDPPFFSNRHYEVIWGDKGEIRSFEDRFSGGIDHYISWLKERVVEMHRILKHTGSIFLHCDFHADAYIRVQILDKIFGPNNFRNEIIWCYKKWSIAGKSFSKNHDNIFWYTKSNDYTFNQQFQDRAESTLKRFGNSKIISGFDDNGIRKPSSTSDEESKGVKMSDWWEIPIIAPSSNERIGYPTQKPEKLLERIIRAGSNEKDVVLDPFVGGGTTISVADKLGRKWIGIDQSVPAVKVTEMRMQNQQGLFSLPFATQLHKYDYDTLRYKNAFEFESFIVAQFGGIINIKQRGDLGIDGKKRDNTPIQVKRSDDIGRNPIDNFKAACERYDKNLYDKNRVEGRPVGFIIAFSFGKGAIREVARLRNEENVIIELVKVGDIVPIAKRPSLKIEIIDKGKDEKGLNEIEFIAKAESESGIAFYMWDFNFKNDKFSASIMLDKIGKQYFKFKAGVFEIAAKVVDNEGLENIESVKIKINGVVERTK